MAILPRLLPGLVLNSYARPISGTPSPSASAASRLIMRGASVVMTCRCHPGFSNQTSSDIWLPRATEIGAPIAVQIGSDHLIATADLGGHCMSRKLGRRIGGCQHQGHEQKSGFQVAHVSLATCRLSLVRPTRLQAWSTGSVRCPAHSRVEARARPRGATAPHRPPPIPAGRLEWLTGPC